MKSPGWAFMWAVGLAIASSLHSTQAAEAPKPYFFKTNAPSFFFSDHLTGATYYRFDPDGAYEEIAREHMGIFPFGSGTWKQDTNGTVTILSTNKNGRERPQDTARPMVYKDQVFLLWPNKSYGTNVAEIMRKIDAPGERVHVYNPFLISEAEYTNSTGKPYPFKYLKQMNPPEAKK